MTIPLIKPIVIIVLVCLLLQGLGVFDMVIWKLKIYQKRLDKKERKYKIAIGKYDETNNLKNRTFLAGKGDTRGEE